MAIITRSQVINRPVEKVFEAIIDGGNFAAWNPTIRASRRLDDGPVGNGTKFEWDLRGFGNVVQELQEFTPPGVKGFAKITNELRRFDPDSGHRWILTDRGDGRTRIDHELETRRRVRKLLIGVVAAGT